MNTELHELMKHRMEKLRWLRERGIDPFVVEKYDRTHTTAEALANFNNLEGKELSIAGRITSLRAMGKATFAHIQDFAGRIQVYMKSDAIGDEAYNLVRALDIGDIIGVRGQLGKTKTDEVTVFVSSLQILTKALRPLPIGKQKGDKEWYGLEDTERRYRERYVDLAVNPEVKETMVLRSRIVRSLRNFLDCEGFLEVETPVLQAIAGGAAARPFTTYHNALGCEFHLRISLELYLKRLIVGGFEKVYEIGRVFRNEGLSTKHNPEFTLLELYQAYANLEDMMTIVEKMFVHICQEIYGDNKFKYAGQTIDLSKPWKRLPLLEGIYCYTGVSPDDFESLDKAKAAGEKLGLPMDTEHSIGGIIDKIHERFVQPNLIEPTFVTDYPIDISPLAKKRPDNPQLTRRFESYIMGQELGNAFSEINDPIDQRERFVYQAKMRAAGDAEAHPMDEDFLRALEYGMPPTGGLGIGIDRMVMLLTNASTVRDVILFPQLRPEKQFE